MNITFKGDIHPTQRIMTGFWSFDRAFRDRAENLGFPVRGISEISGREGVGKSTLCYTLAGLIAKAYNGGIVLTDLEEHFDEAFMRSILSTTSFEGEVTLASGAQDSNKLEDMLELLKKDCTVGIVDSIGAISPVSEIEGHMEDANMGRRAKLTAVLCRQTIHASNCKKTPMLVLCTNHVHSVMGGRGTLTSGGVVKNYLFTTRIRITQKEKFDDGSFLMGGKVDKNSFGYTGKSFYLFNLVGWGIHPGLTAVYDCLMSGRAKMTRTIKLDDKSYGYPKQLIEQAEDADRFQPFIEALKGETGEAESDNEEEEE